MTTRPCSATCRCGDCDPDRALDEQRALPEDLEADLRANRRRAEHGDEPYTGPIGGPGEWMTY